jgi:hypothetical protein
MMIVGGALVLAACSSSPARPSRAGARYLAIAQPANRRLDAAFDALADHEKDDLDAARADLRLIVAVERGFDRQLLALRLPAAAADTARVLVTVNESRARLTEQAGAAATLPALRAVGGQLTAANRPVEDQVRALRRRLALPPPDPS